MSRRAAAICKGRALLLRARGLLIRSNSLPTSWISHFTGFAFALDFDVLLAHLLGDGLLFGPRVFPHPDLFAHSSFFLDDCLLASQRHVNLTLLEFVLGASSGFIGRHPFNNEFLPPQFYWLVHGFSADHLAQSHA